MQKTHRQRLLPPHSHAPVTTTDPKPSPKTIKQKLVTYLTFIQATGWMQPQWCGSHVAAYSVTGVPIGDCGGFRICQDTISGIDAGSGWGLWHGVISRATYQGSGASRCCLQHDTEGLMQVPDEVYGVTQAMG